MEDPPGKHSRYHETEGILRRWLICRQNCQNLVTKKMMIKKAKEVSATIHALTASRLEDWWAMFRRRRRNKKMVNGAFKSSLEESYAEWVEDKLMGEKRKRGPVPVPSREETATWVLEAFNAITENDIKAACRAAYFPKGMKLSELEDLTYFGISDSDSSSDSNSDFGTDTDEDDCIEESSSSGDDSSESDDAPTEVVWAKAARGVWGMAHVFDGRL